MAAVMSIRSFDKEKFNHEQNRQEEEYEESCIAENLQNEERIALNMQKKSEDKKLAVINQVEKNNLGKACQRNDEVKNLDVQNSFDLTQGMKNMNLMENSYKNDHENKLDNVVKDMKELVISKKKKDGEKPKKEKKDKKSKEGEGSDSIDKKIKKEKKKEKEDKENEGDDNIDTKVKAKKNKEDKSEGRDNVDKKLTKEEKKEKKEKKSAEKAEEKLKKAEKKEEKKKRKEDSKKTEDELERERRIAENDKYVISRTPFKKQEEVKPKSNLHNLSGGAIVKVNGKNVAVPHAAVPHVAAPHVAASNVYIPEDLYVGSLNIEELPILYVDEVIKCMESDGIAAHFHDDNLEPFVTMDENVSNYDTTNLSQVSDWLPSVLPSDNVIQMPIAYSQITSNNWNENEINWNQGPSAPQAVRQIEAVDVNNGYVFSQMNAQICEIGNQINVEMQPTSPVYIQQINMSQSPCDNYTFINSPSTPFENRRPSFADSGLGNSPRYSNCSPTHSISSEDAYSTPRCHSRTLHIYPAWIRIKEELDQEIKSHMWTCIIAANDDTFRAVDKNGNTVLMSFFRNKLLTPNKFPPNKFLALCYSYGERQLNIDRELLQQHKNPILLKRNNQNQDVFYFIKACKHYKEYIDIIFEYFRELCIVRLHESTVQ